MIEICHFIMPSNSTPKGLTISYWSWLLGKTKNQDYIINFPTQI